MSRIIQLTFGTSLLLERFYITSYSRTLEILDILERTFYQAHISNLELFRTLPDTLELWTF